MSLKANIRVKFCHNEIVNFACSSSTIFNEIRNIPRTQNMLNKICSDYAPFILLVKRDLLKFVVVAQARVTPNILDSQLMSLYLKNSTICWFWMNNKVWKNYSKMSTLFVYNRNKRVRVITSNGCLPLFDRNPFNFLRSFITMVETSNNHYTPETI